MGELAMGGSLPRMSLTRRLPGHVLERLAFLSLTTTRGLRRVPSRQKTTLASPSRACNFRSVIVCEDSDQLINLIATQEGVDVRDEADEGTNAIDVDSLPRLPELSSPAAPQPQQPIRQQQQFVQPPQQFAPQTQFAGQQRPGAPQPQRPVRPVPQRPPPQRPQPSRNPFTSIFSNFRLPFF